MNGWEGWVRGIDQCGWSNSLWKGGVVATVCFSGTEIQALRPKKRWTTSPDEWYEPEAIRERQARMRRAERIMAP